MVEFIYNGRSTKEFNLRIINEVSHELSSHDIETEVVPGRDGVLLLDNQRLKPVERAFPLRLIDDVYQSSTEIAEWLGVKGWHDLELSWDDDFIYQATVINTISISEVLKQLGKLQVVFLVHPIKYLKDSYGVEWDKGSDPTLTRMNGTSINNGQTVINRGNVKAHPLIELTGSGNTVITINGRRTVLEDVQGSITLDMKSRMVYKGNLSAWEKVVREENAVFPYLDVGNNQISWTGDFTMKMVKNEGVRI